MSRPYFTVDGAASLASVPAGARIHVIGVCGVAMAQLALTLAERGYRVSGSDREFYDPMGSLLKASPVDLFQGYVADHVPPDAALVVIANAMFPDNPEVEVAAAKHIPYTSFPQLVGDVLVGDRRSIVVCGTHGKTTTTGMAATVLHEAGLDPSWFIGGVCQSLPASLHIGSGDFSVVEGDEYHSAFYARVPKFTFYRPRTAIINAIEYDHADIYPTIESVVEAFRALFRDVPDGGLLLCCTDFPLVRRLVDECRQEAPAAILTFGHDEDCAYRLVDRRPTEHGQFVDIATPDGDHGFTVPVIGAYNALNALAAFAALVENGVDPALVARGLQHYKPVKRRQQVRFQGGGVTLIEDFAHHPTAVAGTVAAVREAYPSARLWAVFEPRSNTSRRTVFRDQYVTAFDGADEVILAEVTTTSRMNDDVALIDVNELTGAIATRVPRARCLPTPAVIETEILAGLGVNDVVVLMSNGSFGGLPASLEAALRRRAEEVSA